MRDDFLDDGIGVLAHDVMFEVVRYQLRPQGRRIVSGLPLIEVHGQQLEVDRCSAAQSVEEKQQGVAVLATRERDQDAIAGRDQIEICDSPAHIVEELALRIGLDGQRG